VVGGALLGAGYVASRKLFNGDQEPKEPAPSGEKEA
jgi:hypothetical protein